MFYTKKLCFLYLYKFRNVAATTPSVIFIQLRTLSHPRLEQLWKPKNRVLLLVWEKSCRFTKKMCPDCTLMCFGRFFASPELCVCSNWHGDPSGSSRSCTQWRRATRTSDSSSPSSSWACSSLAACSTTLRTGSLTLDSTASPRFEAFQRAKESCFYNIEWTPPKFYPFSVFFFNLKVYFLRAAHFRVCGGVYKPSPPLVTGTSQWRRLRANCSLPWLPCAGSLSWPCPYPSWSTTLPVCFEIKSRVLISLIDIFYLQWSTYTTGSK